MVSFQAILARSQRTFPAHEYIYLRVKEHPSKPFRKTVFEKAIEMREQHPVYKFYIHTRDNYISFRPISLEKAEPIPIPIDDKIWIELFFIFELDKKKNGQNKKKKNKYK